MSSSDSSADPPLQACRSQTIARIATLVVLAGFGIFAFAASVEVGLGSLSKPGAGLWPLITSVGILVPAAVLVFIDAREDYDPWSRKSLRLVVALVALLLYIPLFLTAGFLISSFVLLVVWLRWFGNESWRSSLLVAASSSAGLFILLDVLLGVPLPTLLF